MVAALDHRHRAMQRGMIAQRRLTSINLAVRRSLYCGAGRDDDIVEAFARFDEDVWRGMRGFAGRSRGGLGIQDRAQ